MKFKRIAIIYICLLSLGAVLFQQVGAASAVEEKGPTIIPDDAIRLRILANSNSSEDQNLKRKIRDEINAEITEWVAELTSIEKARKLIENRVPELELLVAEVLKREGVEQTFSIKYGKNVSFPTKMYGNYIYPAGKYEAILVTLGDGKGANWWCVLFPPLCFLDFSNGEAVKANTYPTEEPTEEKADDDKIKVVNQQEDEVVVKSFVAELFKKVKEAVIKLTA